MLYGGGTVLLLAFGLEWAQQQIPGRYGDITTLILAALGWGSSWLFATLSRDPLHQSTRPLTTPTC
jgi:hypothetical protein